METIYYLFCVFIITLFSMVLHELAHGIVAYWLGDQTARVNGRLSLNPLKHIDPIMTIAVPVILALLGGPIFGGAKPVPVDKRNLKGGAWGFALVAIAGPLTNFILAFLFFILYVLISPDGLLMEFLLTGISVNLGFMLFNILPIPPLDGSRVLYAIAPDGIRRLMDGLEQIGFVVIYALLIFGATFFSAYMMAATTGILNFFFWIVGQ